MRLDSLSKHFEAMGARIRFRKLDLRRFWLGRPPTFTIDIGRDRHGSFFDFALTDKSPEFEILQAVPKERHLLLLTSNGRRFLCGHDERHWFVARIGQLVSTVRDAKRALMPAAVRERTTGLKPSSVDNRRNRAFKRQGEWFFIPIDRDFSNAIILKDEPLQRRSESTPHICEELVRIGGETVYIVGRRVYTAGEFQTLRMDDTRFRRRPVRTMVRNPQVYVRGYVRHADHATIRLEGWHRVLLNAERTSRNVAFLD
jgi:hypothetical protein